MLLLKYQKPNYRNAARALGAAAVLSLSGALADPVTQRVMVVFTDDPSPREVASFIADWSAVGVREIRREPALNGLVLELPNDLSAADIGRDPLVKYVSR